MEHNMTDEEKKRILAEEEALLKQEEALLKQQELELRKTQELKDQARLERERILEQQKTEKMEKAKKRKKKWIIGLAIFFGLGIIGQFMPDKNSAAYADFEKNREALQKELSEMQKKIQGSVKAMNLESVDIEDRGGLLILSLKDNLFAVGSADVGTDLKINLAKIAGILLSNKDVNIDVQGHTDNTGDSTMNQKLSELRAMNVVSVLVEQGVDKNRLTFRGLGQTQPIADNSTENGRKKNRRVDLVIVDKK